MKPRSDWASQGFVVLTSEQHPQGEKSCLLGAQGLYSARESPPTPACGLPLPLSKCSPRFKAQLQAQLEATSSQVASGDLCSVSCPFPRHPVPALCIQRFSSLAKVCSLEARPMRYYFLLFPLCLHNLQLLELRSCRTRRQPPEMFLI